MPEELKKCIKDKSYEIQKGKNGEVYAYTPTGKFIQSADNLEELEADFEEIRNVQITL